MNPVKELDRCRDQPPQLSKLLGAYLPRIYLPKHLLAMKFLLLSSLLSLTSAISIDYVSSSSLVDTTADAFPVPGDQPLTFCKDPSDYILKVHNVDLIPNPPVPGEKLTIKANGTFSEEIEEGATVFLQVRYGLITLIKQEADMCEQLPKYVHPLQQ